MSLASFFASTALGQQLWTVGVPPAGKRAPSLTVSSRDVDITPLADSSKWAFRLRDSSRVFGVATVAVVGPLEAGTAAPSIEVRLDASGASGASPIKVFMHVVPADDSPARVSELHATNLSDPRVTTEELFYTLLSARQMASSRVREMSSGWARPFGVHDAKAFAKVLEASRDLGRSANVILSPDVKEVLRVVERQLGDRRGVRVFQRAGIDTAYLRAVVRDSRMIDMIHVQRVAKGLKQQHPQPTPESCRKYAALLNSINSDIDRRVLDATGEMAEGEVVLEVSERVRGCERTQAVAEVSRALTGTLVVRRSRRPDVNEQVRRMIKSITR